MNTDQIAQQLELAAQILRTGHPWEVWTVGQYEKPEKLSLLQCLEREHKIRLALAMPPDGSQLHNPDNLDAEKVGAGFRLTLPNEKPHKDAELWYSHDGKWAKRLTSNVESGYGKWSTYRLPLSVLWPSSKPDPYAELKKSHAEGIALQYANANSGGTWSQWHDYNGSFAIDDNGGYRKWREKPKPSFQLPPPPPGMQWHAEDNWKDGDLPDNNRPLFKGETIQAVDQVWEYNRGPWVATTWTGRKTAGAYKMRTTRPLIFTYGDKTWTWHKPGDPMPCDGKRTVDAIMAGHTIMKDCNPENLRWSKLILCDNSQSESDIIGWRYADEEKQVPLDRTDVTPYTRFRVKNVLVRFTDWIVPSTVNAAGITFATTTISFDTLAADYERNDSLQTEWDPEAWKPCTKIKKK